MYDKYQAEVKLWYRIVTDVKQTYQMSSIRTLALKFAKTSKAISTLSETCCYRYLLDFGNISLLNLVFALHFTIYKVHNFFSFFLHVAGKTRIADLLRYLLIFAPR